MDSIEDMPGKTGHPRGRYIGRPMPRFEDLRLLRGGGRYTDDVSMPGEAYAVFVRAPHAHARIAAIDAAAARPRPRVLAVLTGEDYLAARPIGLSHFPNPAHGTDVRIPCF